MARKTGKISIRNVAQAAGVSVATVSNVVRDRKKVTEAVKSRVMKAISDLNYTPDRAAIQLREGRNRIIGVMVPSLGNPFFTAIIACLEDCARRDGYDIIVASAGEENNHIASRLKALMAWRPAGMIVLPSDDIFVEASLLDGADMPYVVLDRLPDSSMADKIAVENGPAAAEAMAHLSTLGHRDVLVLATTLSIANIRERCAGITTYCAHQGLPAPHILEVGHHAEEGPQALTDILNSEARPTALIALTNSVTLGALRCLNRSGCTVPGDMSLVGYDDYAWMRAMLPPITAICQPVDELGVQSWSRLMRRIAGDNAAPMQIRLPCTFAVRGSTTSPKKGRIK